jgi:hypothetical protein
VIFRGSEKRRTYTEFIEDAEITEKRSVAWVGEGLTPEGVSYRMWGREEEWDASAGSDTAGDSDEVGDAV